jgi:hypothetical protein
VSHNPERDAAAYLLGEMRPRRARRFEEHLVECEQCWNEVDLARFGRSLTESARELAPHELREDIRAAIALAEGEREQRPRTARALVVLGALVSVALGATVLVLRAEPQQPFIATAVRNFRTGSIPHVSPPGQVPPDLSRLGLTLEQTGSGVIAGQTVDAFTYRSPTGQLVVALASAREIPHARGARYAHTAQHSWTAKADGVTMVCSGDKNPWLLLSADKSVLRAIAEQWHIDAMPAPDA